MKKLSNKLILNTKNTYNKNIRSKTINNNQKSFIISISILILLSICFWNNKLIGVSLTFIALITLLIISLLSRRKILEKAKEQEWIRDGQIEIISSVRGILTTKETASRILNSLCKYLDSPLGAVYKYEDSGNLKLLSGYSIQNELKAIELLKSGGNILSTAIKEKKISIDNDLPEEYFHINSSLGRIKPKNRLIAPVIIEDSPIAVIEIARLKAFSQQDEDLMNRITEGIGLSLIASISKENVTAALEETKQQAEELRISNASLESKTQELEESQDELKTQTQELEKLNQDMEHQSAEIEEQNKELSKQNQEIEEQSAELKRRMQFIEQANKYKSEFLANMSHELRTPLNSLLILAKSFSDNEDGNLNKDQIEEAEMIYNGGVELLSLINDVLDFSKIEAGKLTIIKDHEQLEPMINKLKRQFDPLAKEKNISVKKELDNNCPDIFYSDIQRIEQILKNLLSNAIKFTKEGSVTLKAYQEDDQLAFSVSDTGIGIDESKINDIFEAFQQEDGSIDRKYGGTGLGLSISSQLANLLGGRITLQSVKNKGSVFTFWLPLEDEVKYKKEKSQIETSYEKDIVVPELSQPLINAAPLQKTILIIEDDPSFLKTLIRITKKQGYDVIASSNGKDALMQLQINKVNAIILDLMLPDMDGLYILEQIKSNIKTRHIPVHIISARDENNKNIIKKGAIGYLTKPVTTEQIDNIFIRIENIHQDNIKQVLVIEDDINTQKAITKLVKNKDVEITMVGSGDEGFKALSKKKFDCIILDIQLPDITGFEWLEEAEELKDYIIPPVIIYTARELSKEETIKLEEYTGSIIIKGAHSPERLVDEVSLFLHSIEDTLSED